MSAEGGSPPRNLVGILVFMVVVGTLATLAYMAAGRSFADASYVVVLTVYILDYDGVRPITTPLMRAIAMGTVVIGCTGMILFTSTLVQLATVLQLRQIPARGLGGNVV